LIPFSFGPLISRTTAPAASVIVIFTSSFSPGLAFRKYVIVAPSGGFAPAMNLCPVFPLCA
jgi:hypothetical protein